MSLRMSASQTVGPFFAIGLSWLYHDDLAGPDAEGEVLRVEGRVLDGDGAPIPDAVLEIWQADPAGRYAPQAGSRASAKRAFQGFGRIATTFDGRFGFRTLKPGSVQGQAPHLNVHVFMRGLLKPAKTRLYFAGDPQNEQDPVLALVPQARRGTLLAERAAAGTFGWVIRMQGAAETVFFEY